MTEPTTNLPELSVSELAGALKRTVEDRFGHVRVRGEISGLARPASGHVYLALKDDSAVLDAVMWKGVAAQLRFRPEDGLEVIATGKLTTYPGRSKYQIVIERLEPAGVGALMALLDERRRTLTAEGLFADARKRSIPYIPEVIGVVTSPTGAVIRDILHRLAERFPRRVLVWPVIVQGEGAAAQIAAAIRGFNALSVEGDIRRPDVLIVARGGGSIEDLWAFNEEIVVRAVAASTIPVISAVGHETDTTLIDYAADKRAPTPTAAAEMAVPVQRDLVDSLMTLNLRLKRAMRRHVDGQQDQVRALARAMPHPRHVLGLAQQRFDEQALRLPRALSSGAMRWQARLERQAARLRLADLERLSAQTKAGLIRAATALDRAGQAHLVKSRRPLDTAARLLETLSYTATLARGYAVVRKADGHVMPTADLANKSSQLTIEFHDGTVDVIRTHHKPADTKITATQESLF